MSPKRSASQSLLALAARSPLKMSLTPRTKALIAALTLILVWVVGPRLEFQQHQITDDDLEAVAPALEDPASLPFLPLLNSRPSKEDKDKADLRTPPGQILTFAEAGTFCRPYHLAPHNASAPLTSLAHAQHATPPQRRIYDLLVVTPTTSADVLRLHLASIYQYVDYIVLLEAPFIPATKTPASSGTEPEPLSAAPLEAPSILDEIWTSHLATYQSKIIRHTLSQHSHDFKTGLDYAATTRNALYTRVIPLLTGKQKVQLGDVLLISDVEELVRPVALKVLRNCQVPERTTIRTRKYWYSYQWMKVGGRGATPGFDVAETEAPKPEEVSAEMKVVLARRAAMGGDEWWPHPQVTVYQGADTILPDDLRRHRELDQYVFGDGGWTCYLCYPTITEMLAKIGELGVIWASGPRWKGAGRVVNRVAEGINLLDRSNLSRIDANADLPAQLQNDAGHYAWMLDRDGPGAGFSDFDAPEHARYLAKKKEVDAQPDFETTRLDLELGPAGTAGGETFSPASWRLGGDGTAGGAGEDGLGLTDARREMLADIRDRVAALSPEDLRVLTELSAGVS